MTNMKISITLSFKNYNKIFGKLPSSLCNIETRDIPFQNACFEFNKYFYDVCNSHNCQTVTLNKRKSNATISLPISIQHIIRGPNGGLTLIILGAQGGKN